MAFFGFIDRQPGWCGVLGVDAHRWLDRSKTCVRSCPSTEQREKADSPLRDSMGEPGGHGSMTVWTVVETWTAIVVTCLGFSLVVDGGVEMLCLAGWANMFSWMEVEVW